ncbi:hypothetical protein SESBI_31579 [Sesbania bispinosa]|nr:hypothetical protein SESBI_31579 [Sesbania bispinosa]
MSTPMADEGSVAGGEALVDVSGASNEASNSFPWVESAVLSRTSILLSPESLIPFRSLVRSRFPEVSRFLILELPAGNEYICSGPSSPSSPAFTFLLKDEEAEVKKAKEVISELENLRENFKKLSIEKEKVDADLADLKKDKEKFDNLLSEKTKLLEAVEEKLVAEQKGRKEDADHLKAEITFQYEQGFEKAVDQVKFLHPEINVDEVDAFKEVRGGRLVDIPDEG